MALKNLFSFLSKDPEEQRNLLMFGLSMTCMSLAIPLYGGSVVVAFNAQYGITPALLANISLPARVLGIVVMLAGTGFIDRVRNRVAFNAWVMLAPLINCASSLVMCLGPESFRTVKAICAFSIIFGVPASIIGAFRGGADAMVQCRILHNEIRSRFWSIFGIIGGLGGLGIGFFITWLLANYSSRFSLFIVTLPGAFFLILSALFAGLVRELPDLQNVAPPKKEPVLKSIANIVGMKQFRIMMPANFMRSMGDGCVAYALLLALQSWDPALPQKYAGYHQTLCSFAPFLGYIILAMVGDRFGPGIVLPVVDTLMGVSMVCMAAIHNGLWFLGATLVYNALLTTESAAIPLAHYEVVPNEVMGAFNNVRLLLLTLTGLISGTVAGNALKFFNPVLVFAVGAAIKVSAGLLYSYGIFTLRKHKEAGTFA